MEVSWQQQPGLKVFMMCYKEVLFIYKNPK